MAASHSTILAQRGIRSNLNSFLRSSICSIPEQRRMSFLLFFLIAFCYGYFHQRHFANPMAISRLDLLHSLVLQHSFAIDVYEKNTPDKAFSAGHYYCDKAPGAVAIAFPFFYLSSKLLSAIGVTSDSTKYWLASSWLTVSCSIGVFTAAGMSCLYIWLRRLVSHKSAFVCTIVAAFGSPVFPYATMLMSHAVVVSFLSIALYLLRLEDQKTREMLGLVSAESHLTDTFAGFACGMAIACEYSAALVALCVIATVCHISLHRGCWCIAGAVPPILLIPLYNWICTGSPFVLTYSREAFYFENSDGFFGIHIPNIANLFHILLSTQQGLFCWTPFLLLAFFGYRDLYYKSRSLFGLCYFVPMLQAVIISGYYTSTAGFTLGPRFLSPSLPLLLLPASLASQRFPRVAIGLAVVSVLGTGCATLVDAQLPSDATNPLFSFYLPEFFKGNFVYNLGTLCNLSGVSAILPLFIIIAILCIYFNRAIVSRTDQQVLHVKPQP